MRAGDLCPNIFRDRLTKSLVESHRKEGKPRQKTVKYLGCIGEGHIDIRSTGALIDFWNKTNASLTELAGQGLTEDEVARTRQNLAAKVKPPSDEKVRGYNATMVAFFWKNNEFLYEPSKA